MHWVLQGRWTRNKKPEFLKRRLEDWRICHWMRDLEASQHANKRQFTQKSRNYRLHRAKNFWDLRKAIKIQENHFKNRTFRSPVPHCFFMFLTISKFISFLDSSWEFICIFSIQLENIETCFLHLLWFFVLCDQQLLFAFSVFIIIKSFLWVFMRNWVVVLKWKLWWNWRVEGFWETKNP